MSQPNLFKKGRAGKRPRYAAFDFETDGLGGHILACSYIMEGQEKAGYLIGNDIAQQIFDIMCEHHDYTWYAHNAQYELRYFIDRLKEYGERVEIFNRSDSDVFMVTFKLPEYGDKAVLKIMDSMALLPDSLARLAASLCPELPKLTMDFETVDFDPDNPEHEAYSRRDSETLLACLIAFDELLFDHFEIHPRATTASTAMAAWEITLGENEYYKPTENIEEFCRSGYFGGLVFLTDTGLHENARTYDINSSYPARMESMEFPTGTAMRSTLIQSGVLGMYRVTVRAPDDLIVPILPKRHKGGIVWPGGTFETTVTSPELEFAMQHGYRVLTVHEGIVWTRTCRPFRTFVQRCKAIRNRYKGEALELVAKLMQNSLYGKFGARRERRKFYAYLSDEDAIGAEPWGDFYVKTETAEIRCLPQWAAFITAYARIALLRPVYVLGPDRAIYGDTDSITVEGELPERFIGSDYGLFKLEKDWRYFRARAPKVYAGEIDGEIRGAAKGTPKKTWMKQGVLDAVFRGESRKVYFDRLERFVTAMKTGYIGTHEAERSISDIRNAASWRLCSDGSVRPRTWQEIAAEIPDDPGQRDRASEAA